MKRLLLSIVDHALVAALMLIGSGLWLDKPIWRVGKSLMLLVGLFAAAYFICAIAIVWCRPKDGRSSLVRVLLAGTTAFGLAFMALVFAEWRWPATFGGELPRIVPFASAALGMVSLIVLNWVLQSRGRVLQVVVPLVLASLVVAACIATTGRVAKPPSQEVSYLDTSLHVLKSTAYRSWVDDAGGRGGAIAPFEDGYLLAAGSGAIYFVDEEGGKRALQVRKLKYGVPFNPEDFSRAARGIFGDAWTDNFAEERLRVADLLVKRQSDGRFRVFVSHHYWKQAEKCFVVRLSMLEGSEKELMDATGNLTWRTLYESKPCLQLNIDGHRGGRFGGLQIGGAMALLNDEELLLAVGDHEFDGWNRTPSHPQDEASAYGKIFLIGIDTGQAEVYSLGHRNPQGLYVDSHAGVWETEHGPRGGDELNRIQRGANYGWPLETFGTEYRLHNWPMTAAPELREALEKPVVAFVPSIALSALAGIDGKLFTSWEGDLLLVSLSGELRRIRIVDGRAIVIEPFTIEGRIRDVTVGRDGRIVLWTDGQDVIFLEPVGTDAREALVFQCTGCHTFSKWENASIGPNLWRVFGRRVGTAEGFEYSEAMLKSGGRWNRERLDQFLADPDGVVPGTTMQFEGIPDPAQRDQLIDFLEQLRE